MSDHSQVKITLMNYDINRGKSENPLKVMDLSLRDGHQSLFATRGRTEDMIPIAELIDQIGFWAVEMWGGATFDTMHRFLNEDPWERIRTLKRYFKNTPLAMLLRGQNLVGYRNYSDDLVRAFIDRASENGMDIFRTFDALNDFRNFEVVFESIKKSGKHFQGCICYSLTEPRLGGEVYNLDYYVKKTKELEKIGVDSICIKDMAGLLAPYDAYSLIKYLKSITDIPLHLHSHFTSGMSSMTHLKAIEAGIDIIDTCMSPYAYRTSHPAIEPLVMTLLGTNRDTGFDINKLANINEIIEKNIIPKYRHFIDDSKMSIIDINVLLHQTPGGMLSNLVKQLKEMEALDKLDNVYKELPRVRKELGQIPLVTPTSQIVGIQTVNNVLFDTPNERYTMVTDQVKDLCYGLYGETSVPINEEIVKKVLKNYEKGNISINCRPGEILEPELKKAKKEVGDLAMDMDDLILYAMYPVTGKKFLKWKYGQENPPNEVFPITMKQVEDRSKLVKKALSGELIERKKEILELNDNVRKFNVFIEDESFEVGVEEIGESPILSQFKNLKLLHSKETVENTNKSRSLNVIKEVEKDHIKNDLEGSKNKEESLEKDISSLSKLIAPMPGMIVKYEKKVGDKVTQGETVIVLEAMKMENALSSPCDGIINKIYYNSGDSVTKGDILATIT